MTRQTAETVVWRVPGPGTAGELSAASENPLPVITRRLTAANPRQLVSISQTPDGSFFVPYSSATIPEGQACSYTVLDFLYIRVRNSFCYGLGCFELIFIAIS